MVAIFRADLTMPVGKLAAQAGHAFLGAWRQAAIRRPELAVGYDADVQMKLCLQAPDADALRRICCRAAARAVPYALITDEGRTVFDGPTLTVLGLGPMTKTDSNALTRGLALL